ncbi:hypothetical protein TRVL_05768 [Trypanosoma vivax]|nr:hypothetical protein TRVL_05768 [Trypanosoma vivax]
MDVHDTPGPHLTEERRVWEYLQRTFPMTDPDMLQEMAALVMLGRYTLSDAIDMVRVIEDARQINDEGWGEENCSSSNCLQTENCVDERSAANESDGVHEKATIPTSNVGCDKNRAGEDGQHFLKLAEPHTPVGDPSQENFTSIPLSGDERLKTRLFTTTMTGDRRVRDHCRRVETLLYLKRIQYETVNIADNVLEQRRMRQMYAASTGRSSAAPLPSLFVGTHFVGDYERLQELEDEGVLIETIVGLGYDGSMAQ